MGVSRQNGTHLFIFAYGRARALPGTAHLRKVESDNVGEGLAHPVIATCTNFIGRSRAPPLLGFGRFCLWQNLLSSSSGAYGTTFPDTGRLPLSDVPSTDVK